MAGNPLRYDTRQSSNYGHKARVCLPCAEREVFISECAKRGDSTIGLRQKNRYIDEFLVYVNKEYKVCDPKKLTADHFIAFKRNVLSNQSLKDSTKHVKIALAKQWLEWLYINGYLKQPIV